MGKVKSAIITALFLLALITLTLAATISFPIPGSNAVYNSFVSMIPLGSDLTGNASVIIYPDGVITEAEYERDVYDNSEKLEEYQDKYEHFISAGLYIDKDKLTDSEGNADNGETLAASVKADAEIISERFAGKGYSSYSVTVVDGYAIRISVPTTFTYAAYKGDSNADDTAYNSARSIISNTMWSLSRGGELSLRSSSTYTDTNAVYKELDADNPYTFNSFFKKASVYSRGGTTALKIELTNSGFDNLNTILEQNSSTLYLFVGETSLGLTFSGGQTLSDKTLYFTASQSAAQDYAILISSVAKGNMLSNEYAYSSNNLVNSTALYGEHAAIFLAVFVLVMVLLAAVLPIIRYKLLGLVNALMVLTYTVALLTAIMLIGTELTIGGVFTALLGLVLLSFSNFYTFEAVRREVALGRTIGAAIKLGYKRSLFAVLDVHIMLLIAVIFMALVGVGELASCGMIFLVGAIASYTLYWFTRFMWYVISSFKRNKFAFCGFVREVDDDE